jgi:hypothetical protein
LAIHTGSFLLQVPGLYPASIFLKMNTVSKWAWWATTNGGKEGSINIESKKYIYKVQNNPLAELTIYDAFTNQPLASCALTTNVKGASLSLSSQNNGADSNYLLLGLCWFLFLPVAKENVVEYAA